MASFKRFTIYGETDDQYDADYIVLAGSYVRFFKGDPYDVNQLVAVLHLDKGESVKLTKK